MGDQATRARAGGASQSVRESVDRLMAWREANGFSGPIMTTAEIQKLLEYSAGWHMEGGNSVANPSLKQDIFNVARSDPDGARALAHIAGTARHEDIARELVARGITTREPVGQDFLRGRIGDSGLTYAGYIDAAQRGAIQGRVEDLIASGLKLDIPTNLGVTHLNLDGTAVAGFSARAPIDGGERAGLGLPQGVTGGEHIPKAPEGGWVTTVESAPDHSAREAPRR